MKAKEFWDFMCEEMNYRFFIGVPCLGLKSLYDTMHPKFMHYIPAVDESTALSMASGAEVAGTKSVVMMDASRINKILDCFASLSDEYKIPVLIVAYDEHGKAGNVCRANKIPYTEIKNFKKGIKILSNKIEKEGKPGLVILGKGTLS